MGINSILKNNTPEEIKKRTNKSSTDGGAALAALSEEEKKRENARENYAKKYGVCDENTGSYKIVKDSGKKGGNSGGKNIGKTYSGRSRGSVVPTTKSGSAGKIEVDPIVSKGYVENIDTNEQKRVSKLKPSILKDDYFIGKYGNTDAQEVLAGLSSEYVKTYDPELRKLIATEMGIVSDVAKFRKTDGYAAQRKSFEKNLYTAAYNVLGDGKYSYSDLSPAQKRSADNAVSMSEKLFNGIGAVDKEFSDTDFSKMSSNEIEKIIDSLKADIGGSSYVNSEIAKYKVSLWQPKLAEKQAEEKDAQYKADEGFVKSALGGTELDFTKRALRNMSAERTELISSISTLRQGIFNYEYGRASGITDINAAKNNLAQMEARLKEINEQFPVVERYVKSTEERLKEETERVLYGSIQDREDFAEKSKSDIDVFNNTKNKEGHVLYGYINNFEHANGKTYQQVFSNYDGTLGHPDWDIYKYLTPEEKGKFNYLYNSEKYARAVNYLATLDIELSKRRYEKDSQAWAKNAEEHPVLTSIATVAAAPWRAYSSLGAVLDDTSRVIKGEEIDPYSTWHGEENWSTVTRNTVTENIDNEIGKFMYGVSMSIGDNVANMAFGSVAGAGASAIGMSKSAVKSIISNFVGAAMGTTSAASSIVYNKERGLSDETALGLGIAQGLTEMLTEKYSIEQIIKEPKSALLGVLRGMAAEGSEEIASGAITMSLDYLVTGSDSEISQLIADYKEKGYSDKGAVAMALFMTLGEQGLAGAVSGGIMGAGSNTLSKLGSSGAQQDTEKPEVLYQVEDEIGSVSDVRKPLKDINKGGRIEGTDGSQFRTMWTISDNVLTEQDVALVFRDIENINNRNSDRYEMSADGDYILEINNKLVYTDADADYPTISSVVTFGSQYEEDILLAKELILNEERSQSSVDNAFEVIETMYGQGFVNRVYFEDSSAYAQMRNRGRKGSSGGEIDSRSGKNVDAFDEILAQGANEYAEDAQKRIAQAQGKSNDELLTSIEDVSDSGASAVAPVSLTPEQQELKGKFEKRVGRMGYTVISEPRRSVPDGTIGYVDFTNKEIYISPGHFSESLLTHELTHVIDRGYNGKYVKSLISFFKEQLPSDWNEKYDEVKAKYEGIAKKNADFTYTESTLEAETLAEMCVMLSDKKYLNLAKDMNVSTIKQICVMFKYMASKIMMFFNDESAARKMKIASLKWQMALYKATKKGAVDGGSGVAFSVKEIKGDSGTSYGIGVFLDSNLLTGLTEAERKQMVKEYVVSELNGESFIAYDKQGTPIDIRIAQKDEYFKNEKGNRRQVIKEIYSKYNGNKVKQEAVVLADELISTAEFNGKTPAKHKHDWLDDNGKNDWDIWEVYIQEKNKAVWKATLNVANTQNGEKILYDIGPIKMVEQAGKSATSTTNYSISDVGENVNKNISTNDDMLMAVSDGEAADGGSVVAGDGANDVKDTVDTSAIEEEISIIDEALKDESLSSADRVALIKDKVRLQRELSGGRDAVGKEDSARTKKLEDAVDAYRESGDTSDIPTRRSVAASKKYYDSKAADIEAELKQIDEALSDSNNLSDMEYDELRNRRDALLTQWREVAKKNSVLSKVSDILDEIDTAARPNHTWVNEIAGWLSDKKNLIKFGTYNLNDIERNFKIFFGKHFKTAYDKIIQPLYDSKKAYTEGVTEYADRLKKEIVDGLGIKKGSRMSAAVQWLGEGQKPISKKDGAALKPYTYEDCVAEFGEDAAKRIQKAVEIFREMYDELLDQVNETMAMLYPNNPDKLIPRRSDYFRHFQEMSQGFEGLKNILQTNIGIDPMLVGVSENTKPKSKFQSFAQSRTGNSTTYDAVGGFLDYLPAAQYSIHIDPNIVNVRSLAYDLASAKAAENNGNGNPNANGFIAYLQRYANSLAGKTTSHFDRAIQDSNFGRTAMAVVSWLNNKTKASAVLGNINSVLAQVTNLKNVIGKIEHQADIVQGAVDALAGLNPEGRVAARYNDSGFLKERYLDRVFSQFDRGWDKVNPVKWAGDLLGFADEIGTRITWNAAYNEAVRKNIANPVQYADNFTRACVAGRGIGEEALIFKSQVAKMFLPFRTEVLNDLRVQQDILFGEEYDIWEKNAGEGDSSASTKITPDMTEKERYEALKNRTIKVAQAKELVTKNVTEEDVKRLKTTQKSVASKILRKLSWDFGAVGKHSNSDIELEFEFSNGSLKESVNKQKKNYADFAKMLTCFDEVIENAVGIEVHKDKYAGTERADTTLKQSYVLASAFSDGSEVYPVKLLVKEFVDKPNKLHVAVVVNKKENTVVEQALHESATSYPQVSSIISLSQLLNIVNDEDLDKYIPKQFKSDKKQDAFDEIVAMGKADGSKKLTYEQEGAILRYKGGGSYNLNRKLRKGLPLPGEDQATVQLINEALEKLPVYRGTVYRNIGFYTKEEFEAFVASLETGIVVEKAFTSSSKIKGAYDVEMPFNAHYEIESKTGKDIEQYGEKSEKEVLFKSGTSFDVVNVKVLGNTVDIILKESAVDEITDTRYGFNDAQNFERNHSQFRYVPKRERISIRASAVRGGGSTYDRIFQKESDGYGKRSHSGSRRHNAEGNEKAWDDSHTEGYDVSYRLSAEDADVSKNKMTTAKRVKNIMQLYVASMVVNAVIAAIKSDEFEPLEEAKEGYEENGLLGALMSVMEDYADGTGNPVAFDPIYDIATGIYQGVNEGESAGGDIGKATLRSAQNLAGDLVSNNPFSTAVMGMVGFDNDASELLFNGNVYVPGGMGMPLASNVATVMRELGQGDYASAAAATVKPFLPMGTQIDRSAKGIYDYTKGYATTEAAYERMAGQEGSLKYLIEKTPETFIKSLLFGPGAFSGESDVYYNDKTRKFTPEEQAEILSHPDYESRKVTFDDILAMNVYDSERDERKQAAAEEFFLGKEGTVLYNLYMSGIEAAVPYKNMAGDTSFTDSKTGKKYTLDLKADELEKLTGEVSDKIAARFDRANESEVFASLSREEQEKYLEAVANAEYKQAKIKALYDSGQMSYEDYFRLESNYMEAEARRDRVLYVDDASVYVEFNAADTVGQYISYSDVPISEEGYEQLQKWRDYSSTRKPDNVDRELLRLSNATGSDINVSGNPYGIISYTKSKVDYKIEMPDNQIYALCDEVDKAVRSALSSLFAKATYKNATAEVQKDLVASVKRDVRARIKDKYKAKYKSVKVDEFDRIVAMK